MQTLDMLYFKNKATIQIENLLWKKMWKKINPESDKVDDNIWVLANENTNLQVSIQIPNTKELPR